MCHTLCKSPAMSGGLGLRARYAEEDTAGIITAHQLLAVLIKVVDSTTIRLHYIITSTGG